MPPLDAVSNLNDRSLELQSCGWDAGAMEALEGCGAMGSGVGLRFMESPFMEPQAQPNPYPYANPNPDPIDPILTLTLTLTLTHASVPLPLYPYPYAPMIPQMQPPEEVERLIKDRNDAFVRETGAGITMAHASHTKLFGSDDGSIKFHAAANPSPSLSLPVLPEVKGGSRVSTSAGEAALARERRARCQLSDDEPHAEQGLLLSPQQLHNVFRGLSNNTLSGL